MFSCSAIELQSSPFYTVLWKNLYFAGVSDFWSSKEVLILTDQKLCHHRGRLGLMKGPKGN